MRAAERDQPTAPQALIPAAEEEPSPEPTPEPTPWPTPEGLKGVDVSHWNGHPDFAKMRAKGMRFVFSKASQGTSLVDNTYRRHTRDARAAGLLAGAYHFFDYNRSGVKQARHFLSTVRDTTGLEAMLPLVVDVETLGSLGTPDQAKARTRLHALLDELYRQTGRYPMIYTSRHMWQKVVGAPTSFGGYPLWVACWRCDTVHLPSSWRAWDFWQYGQARFDGGRKLDRNVFRKSLEKLEVRTHRPLLLAQGATWTRSSVVEADLRGFDGTQVRYAIGSDTFGPWQPYQRRVDLRLKGKQGRQDIRVQVRSFRGVKSTVLRERIKLDTVAPKINGPKLRLRTNARVPRDGGRVPTVSSMGASDASSGLRSSKLRVSCGDALRGSKTRPDSSIDLSVSIDRRDCSLTAKAKDIVGNRASRSLSPRVRLHDLRRGSERVTFSGRWRVSKAGDALGRTIARASARGAMAKVRIEGTQFGVVARRGPSGGRLAVIVDGRRVGVVDLYAATSSTRRVIYVANVPQGKHVVKLRATGSKQRKSTGTNVWLDAVLVLDRHK